MEIAAEGIGRLDDGAVAADAGHRRQRVHLLRAAQGARQAVDGKHRGLFRGQLLHQVGILGRPDEADQDAAFAHQRHLVRAGRARLEDDVGRSPQGCGVPHDFGPGGAIGVVAEIGGIARAGFDGDLETQLDEFFDDIGHRGHALFAGEGFSRNAYALGVTTLGVATLR